MEGWTHRASVAHHRVERFVKINRQFQDLHLETASANWVVKQEVERDICLLYHQLASYSWIQDDLYYGSVFGLPYWQYLTFPEVDEHDRAFLRDGCLVMLFAMACAAAGCLNFYLTPHIGACREALAGLQPADDDTKRMVRAVGSALDLAEREAGELPADLMRESAWAHDRYVRRYFQDIARDFAENPYYRE